MFDCHVHTKFSTDSNMHIEDAIKKAEGTNIGLIITEHMDYNYPRPGEFVFDPDQYFKEYLKFRNNKLLLGVEMGMRMDCILKNKELEKSYPFDYVIGSVHVVDGIDIYESGFYENRKKQEVYESYLKAMLQCIKAHDFVDSLGHIDYITRYAPFEDKELYYDEHKYIIDEILKTAAENEKALELNSKRLHERTAAQNLLKIFKRFYELGGRIITLGSDSHMQDNIGGHFEAAREMAQSSNLRIVYFKERKAHYI